MLVKGKDKLIITNKILGIFLVAFSWIIYGGIFIIPFLSLTPNYKIFIISVFYLLSHITFWIGGFVLGKELIHKYKFVNILQAIKNKG